jgi:hypothetical protein
MRLAAWTTWIVPLVFWVGFFWLFWNVKRWRWSKVKIVAMALACAIAAAVAVLGVVYVIATVFD